MQSTAELRDHLDWIRAVDGSDDVADAMTRLGVPNQAARIYVILRRANGRALSKDGIIAQLYDAPTDVWANLIEVQICRLRKALPAGERIETVRGVGYRLVEG